MRSADSAVVTGSLAESGSTPHSLQASGSRERMPLVRVVRGIRPLFFSAGALLCCRYNEILVTHDFGKTFKSAGRFPLHAKWSRLASLHPILQRISRLHIYRLRVDLDGSLVFLMPPGVYSRPSGSLDYGIFSDIQGRRPVSLAITPQGRWVFGEYPPNRDRSQSIRIFGSDDAGRTWRVLYEFPRGVIRHVHGISYDEYENCFWVTTGDLPHESILFRASVDFSRLDPILSGSAMSRFFWTYTNRDFLVTATDSPNYLNHIVVHHKAGGVTTRPQTIQNSSFFFGVAGDRIFVSTNAEPPEDAEVEHVNETRKTFVWAAKPPYSTWRQVLEYETDLFQRMEALPKVPSGLFQYSTINFPEGENPSGYLVAYGLGVRRYNDAMLVYDASGLDL